ncbi:hypothetical protein C8R46DRAFT_1304933, partial [Mycena filopes]
MTTMYLQLRATPVAYAHPYIVCRDVSSKSLSLWACTAGGEPQLYATLEGSVEVLATGSTLFVAPDRVVTDSVYGTKSTVLVHSLPDGRLVDALELGAGFVDVFPGELVAAAKWGNDGRRAGLKSRVIVYGDGDDGKLGALVHPDGPILEIAFESDVPRSVWLMRGFFIQSQVCHPDPTIHLTRLSSGRSPIRRANFGVPPDEDLLNSKCAPVRRGGTYLTGSFVMAHREFVLDFDEHYPRTALRFIDEETLALGWCTLINQDTRWVQYSAATGVVVAYGWMDTDQGMGVIVLDATTGTVVRTAAVGTPKEKCGGQQHCDLTLNGDTLVVVFGHGQLVVTPLETFIADGFVRDGDAGSPVTRTIPCPEFPLSMPRNAKERRSKAHGAWTWMKDAFVADEFVVAVPVKGSDFAILR